MNEYLKKVKDVADNLNYLIEMRTTNRMTDERFISKLEDEQFLLGAVCQDYNKVKEEK